MMMKRTLLTLLFFLSAPALAQPVESEPLGPAPYNLQNETDPMALGAPDLGAPDLDSQAPVDIAPIIPAEPAPVQTPPLPSEPSAPAADNLAPTPDYPNNPVSGLPPRDPAVLENKIFCTLKASFERERGAIDETTASAMRSYLDLESAKLSYVRSESGNGFSYCVSVKNHADRADVYKALRKLMPAPRASNPPVILSGRGFAPVRSDKEVRN